MSRVRWLQGATSHSAFGVPTVIRESKMRVLNELRPSVG
jgi:hypothetical protein